MRVKYLIIFILGLVPCLANAQALQDINYNYQYSPDGAFSFRMKPVRTVNGWEVLYNLYVKDTVSRLEKFTILWEGRNTLSDKEGVRVNDSTARIEMKRGARSLSGSVFFDKNAKTPSILVAKVVDNEAKRAWVFYEILRNNYAVNCYLSGNADRDILNSFVMAGNTHAVKGFGAGEPLIVSHYATDFPAGSPAFAEAQPRVSSTIRVDSTFTIRAGDSINYSRTGLYLIQKDTTSAQGLAFTVYDDYPKYRHIENLADPLVYISTRQEYDKLKQAGSDKKAFDKVILGITSDAGRARNFMRNYFRRVELANEYFSSFKEGWKTDRGMIFIIFGLPDEVYKFTDREEWNYKNNSYKVSFSFVRSSTLFDPDNYVLIRDKKFKNTWYEIIDLWRNARF